jgi:hypothetical protein
MSILFLLAAALGCAGCANPGFIPADALTTLKNPSHVEVYRTGTLDDHPGYGGKLDGFAVFGTGHVSHQAAADLAAAVTDPSTFDDADAIDDFVPTVGYRFYRHRGQGLGQMSVDVLLGFDGDQMLVVARDEKLREFFRRMFSIVPGRARLLDLVRRAFPHDSVVQSLPAARAPTP